MPDFLSDGELKYFYFVECAKTLTIEWITTLISFKYSQQCSFRLINHLARVIVREYSVLVCT